MFDIYRISDVRLVAIIQTNRKHVGGVKRVLCLYSVAGLQLVAEFWTSGRGYVAYTRQRRRLELHLNCFQNLTLPVRMMHVP